MWEWQATPIIQLLIDVHVCASDPGIYGDERILLQRETRWVLRWSESLSKAEKLYVWQTPRTPHAENFDIIFAFWMSANGSPLCSSSNCEIPPSKCQTFSVAELLARCHVLRDTSWPTSNHFLSSPHCSLPIVHPGPHIPLGQFQQPSFLWDLV